MYPAAQKILRVKTMKGGDASKRDQSIEREIAEFFGRLLKSLNDTLQNKRPFILGEYISVVDFQYYCCISAVLTLLNREITEQEYPYLAVWYNDLMKS